ncbi:creatininase family protein [Naasia sp. SYSU D00948]|uniref:creatininase family protein n=1 Tax=Naasia sp. SYSU D00948 TaxID=2817379 RepID=UPI001B30D5DA|nr:creatininase family protein [Naasia sp. SYSU D00948]
MRWEELTGDAFVTAVERSEGVCLVPLSVVERHGHHLPLGTDTFIGRAVVTRAAAIEPAVVFPDHIYTQIPEARHLPGTIAIDPELMVQLLDNVCREIARNGFPKIVLVNAHGGNAGLVSLFNMLQLYRPRDYVVYLVQPFMEIFGGGVDLPWAPESDGHAGPSETSIILRERPDLVHMDQVPEDDEGAARGRLRDLRAAGVQTGIWWYADHPTHYQGDAAPATADAGERLLDLMAQAVVRAVRAIKADDESRRLQDEFFEGSRAPLRGE